MDAIKLKVGELLLPAIIGPLAFLLMQLAKRTSFTIDAMNPWAKRSALFAIVVGLSVLGSLAGVDFHCDESLGTNCLTTLDPDTLHLALKTLAGAAFAFVLHAGKDSQPNT